MNASGAAIKRPNSGLVLAMLLLVYTFNFLDRQILGILAQPIIDDLQLTDSQFGMLAGVAFALLYSILGVPLALLADRTSRSTVIAASLAIWSGFTALCGTATGFVQLFFYRLGVGVGEAGGVAPSYALIADYFPPEKRARALAIYSLGIPVGLAGGTLLGAYIAAAVDWRMAFLVMGVAGILVAPVFKYIVRDLPRPADEERNAAPLGAVFPILLRKRSFWLISFGAGFSSLCGYGLAAWVPTVLIRSFGFDLVTTGQFMGSLLLIGGTIGVFSGGVLADKLGKRDKSWYLRLPAIAWAITIPTFALGLLSPNPWIAWPLLLIPNGLNILWLGPITTAVQHLVPRHMRATASASFLLINNLIGLGLGPTLIGFISTGLSASYGTESLRYAAVGCLGFYVIATALALLAARTLKRDWVD
ncbi:spinster family MFS transporter [Stakelama tenebrarum]|uniref:MFS transporter n=1 Tax=Stakelama tenebrarum TaxID=2711215 RepID=A0A6G6Y1L7_9SPHN|nr:MFS transporter [Sphingosinithalassobacter tenebrarum]QIG78800.1 MFS transporter [Sphingosinithalassobacter tenebrarum]